MKKIASSIYVRNLDPAVIAKLDELAAKQKISRSEYIRRQLEQLAAFPELRKQERQSTQQFQEILDVLKQMSERLSRLEAEGARNGK